MELFNGKEHALALDEKIIKRVSYLKEQGSLGVLAIILVGDSPASVKYTNVKKEYCASIGVECCIFALDSGLNDTEIVTKVRVICEDPGVSGVIVQLPLPRPSLEVLLDLIPEEKDIDVISKKGMVKYYAGDMSKLSPVIRTLALFTKEIEKFTSNKSALVIGDGSLVGMPAFKYLEHKKFNVTTNNQYVTGQKITQDLVVLAAGAPNLVNGEDLADGCNVIDYGSTIIDGKVVGDLNRKSKIDHLGLVSLTPGGVGPLVVRYLLMNFLGL